MNVQVIPRTAVKGYLRLVRTPLEAVVGLMPGSDAGAKPAAKVAIDHVDATARVVAGTLLGDPVLREDGKRRRAAANERKRGLRLRGHAQETAEKADARVQEREQQARKQRQRARETAESRRRKADTRARKQKEEAAKAESRRREASREIAHEREQAIEEHAPREQLQAAEAKSEALREREKELTARDEARRLADAAGAVKAERKSKQ